MPYRESAQTLPKPSAELIMIAALTRCFLRRLPKKERMEFLTDVTADLRWQMQDVNVIRIRPAAQDAEVAEAQAKAAAWWQAVAEKCAELAR